MSNVSINNAGSNLVFVKDIGEKCAECRLAYIDFTKNHAEAARMAQGLCCFSPARRDCRAFDSSEGACFSQSNTNQRICFCFDWDSPVLWDPKCVADLD